MRRCTQAEKSLVGSDTDVNDLSIAKPNALDGLDAIRSVSVRDRVANDKEVALSNQLVLTSLTAKNRCVLSFASTNRVVPPIAMQCVVGSISAKSAVLISGQRRIDVVPPGRMPSRNRQQKKDQQVLRTRASSAEGMRRSVHAREDPLNRSRCGS